MLDFRNKVILAPMAGVSDFAFRKLCVEQGADYTVTEMISAKALCYKDSKTAVLARILKEETPIAIQIFGSEPKIMAEAARMLSTGNYTGCVSTTLPAAIDVNMGCPVNKIISNKEGGALMKDPVRAFEILSAVVSESAVPVTVKIRAGYDRFHINAPEIAELAERAGVSAVCVHCRTVDQMYRLPVHPEVITAVKRAVSIPVIGNGELMCAENALEMKNLTNCDALMIARGSLGNPFIFAEIKAKMYGKTYMPPSFADRLAMARRHLHLLIADKGERRGLLEARKHISWYIKEFPGASAIRDGINRAENYEEMEKLLEDASFCS